MGKRYLNAISKVKERRQRVLEGKINCIPFPFKRLSEHYYGLEHAEYNIYTANQKVGKSKFVDEVCVYSPFFYSLEHPDKLKIKVIYFSLEMSEDRKFYEFLSHLLYKLDGIRISPKDLLSTKQDKVCPQHIIDLIESPKYEEYIQKWENTVDFITDIKNPTGIMKYCASFAEEKGHWEYRTIHVNGKDERIRDHFIRDDKDTYYIVILDNFTNLTIEGHNTKLTNIELMSKYFIELRDKYGFCINAVQHQSQAQEGIENRKLNQLEPSSDGLGDCKMTVRDINNIWGLFNPFKYGLTRYPLGPNGYDITKFGDYIRFVKLLDGRDGGMGSYSALFFDGATSTFKELPRPDDIEHLNAIYSYIESLQAPPKEQSKTNILLTIKSFFKRKKHG